jgi:hypothetical protein
MKIEISNGELIDKYTILLIKSTRITDETKLTTVKEELEDLSLPVELLKMKHPGIDEAIAALQKVNETLWNIEDSIRDKERLQDFGEEFVTLARSVYFNNDSRAKIKSLINTNTGSRGEVKQYKEY